MFYPNLTNDDIFAITSFFNEVDTDNDGFISVQEINNAMTVTVNGITYNNSQEWLQNYFAAEDFNNDNLISLAELLLYNNNKKGQVTI
jgi:Ca2+-binding EF-hand superfamily protein